ncbi:Alpha/Beta hydrolase protein [Mycena leptocephala]|nr:Alpha/Beta hydrolase protein [Mycena leptocephala]
MAFLNSLKLLAVTALVSSLQVGAQSDTDFPWDSLNTTEELVWVPCYSGFQCTRLKVPLDYSFPDAGSASIAITRYPANCTKSEYRGPILVNPGGPGGSGVDYVVEAGASFAAVIGEQFDIVGFDPRGVSYSRPAVSFFLTAVERAMWTPQSTATIYPALNQTADAVAQQWARAQILGQLAVNRNNGFQYMTTDNTARDMLTITEAFGFEKLQYWGVSYGSVLGATFAAMFPDKVGRVVVDGVVPIDKWYTANLTSEGVDTDKDLQTFIDGCAAAGPDACAFSASSSVEISANLDALSAAILIQPVPVIMPISYGVVDYSFLRSFIFQALYFPYDSFVGLAQGLADLAKGNATTIYAAMGITPIDCECNSTTPFHDNVYDAVIAISCGDAAPQNDTVAQLQAYDASVQAIDSLADIWGNLRSFCSGWKLHREDRFKGKWFLLPVVWIILKTPPGPFGAPNTSFPLFVIGNTADPVTPIAGAQWTADAFPGSVLLTLDSPGHSSLAVPSTCFYSYLRAYFQNGTLPAQGTVCQPDGVLFPPANATTGGVAARGMDGRRAELIEAGRTIGKAMRRATAHKFRPAV